MMALASARAVRVRSTRACRRSTNASRGGAVARSAAPPSTGLVLDVFDQALVRDGARKMREINPEAFANEPDWVLEWFLRDRKLDADKASEKCAKYVAWRSNDGYDRVELERSSEVDEEAATGKAVLLDETDAMDRPVIYVTLTKHEVETRELARTCKLCVRLVDEALERERAKGAGSSETMMCVFDLRGFTMKNADIDFVKFFIKCIFDYFPKRISQVLLIEPPWVFTPVWQIIKPLMGKYAALVKQVKASEAKAYFKEGSSVF